MAFPFDGVSSLISVTAQAAACGAGGHLLRVQKGPLQIQNLKGSPKRFYNSISTIPHP